MDYISIIIDSVETSVNLNFFENKKDSTFAHIFKSKLVKIPITKFSKDIYNFNPNRLQNSAIKAYPLNDRPRGISDINSVKYYQKQIKQQKNIIPIWIIKKNKKYTLLDGAHRIIASYIEEKKHINAYVINL